MPTKPSPLPGNPQSVNTVLDGNGNGQVSVGPSRVMEHWQVDAVAVKASTGAPVVNDALCSTYVGVAGALQSQFLSTTFTGSSGDTCGVGQDITPGQLITAVWTGGDAGATATMTIFGTYTIGPPPS